MLLDAFLDLFLCLLVLCGPTHVLAAEEAPLVAVYAVRGQTTYLPCNLTTAPEDPVILVLWYKNGTKTPVFSVDSRSRGHQQDGTGNPRAAADGFGGRASFQKQRGWSWTLVVREVEFSDQGEYRCRLDFQSSPTHNARVLLHVVDLPRQLHIYSPGGAVVDGVASVQVDRPLTLSCRATGGEPLPNVTWWSGSTLLDSEVERLEGLPSLSTPTATPTVTPTVTPATLYVTNTLHLTALTRAHLAHNLTCMAANTPALPPLSASVYLRETDSELKVEMRTPTGKLSGGRQYDIRCEATGVRPPPVLTWWLRGQQLTQNINVQNLGMDSTVSLLRLLATAGDDGGLLECRSTAPTLPHLSASDSVRLTVHYVPEASISIEGGGSQGRLGSKVVGLGGVGGVGGLRAGDSATLTCAARANPPAYNFTFLFNSILYTVIMSLDFNVAAHQHRTDAPVCEWEGAKEVLATVGEKVEMTCRVRASPPQLSYTWESVIFTPNMEQVRSPLHHQDTGLTSVGWAVADNSSSGAQRAECQPSNDVGPADRPCVFTILLVDEPTVNTHGEEPAPPTETPRNSGGTPVSVVVSGVVVGVVVGVAVVVAGVVTCRARRGHASSPGKTHQYHNASRDSLLELPQGAMYQSCSSHPSCELLTTFSPGPVVVTQVTSGRSSKRSSPLFRKSSTRSAPGGNSPRGMRPRSASCRGGPVHVVEVEADDITTPRVEIQSPSRFSRLSLRGDTFKYRDSPSPLSLQCEVLQQPEPQVELHLVPQSEALEPQLQPASQVHLSPQSFSAPQMHPSHQQHLSPQSYDSTTPQHLHPQVHTVTHPHSIPQITLTSQVHTVTTPKTASHPDPASQSLAGDHGHTSPQRHSSTLTRKYSAASLRSNSPGRSSPVRHTGTPPHSPGILHTSARSGNASHPHTATLHKTTLSHTDTYPHTSTYQLTVIPPHTAPHLHTSMLPHATAHSHMTTHPLTTTQQHTTHPFTGTLSRLASQVHSPAAEEYSQHFPPHSNPHLHQPLEEVPQGDHPLEPPSHHQTQQPSQLSPHPHMEAPTTHCNSPESASIKLYPTFW
nr:uncharacterized protein LOC128695329 [Cherax quadricarinatus]